MAQPMAPMRVAPRLDPKVWGGRRLAQFGLDVPPDALIGEAVVTAGDSCIVDGPFAGQRLQELVDNDPLAVCGEDGLAATGGHSRFPLLIKLLDARLDLSIQLHPDETAAPTGETGKTEAWHFLASEPGARFAMGLRPEISAAEFAAACYAGKRTASLLRWLPATPGTTIVIPPGTVHALGAGCLIFEVQRPSDITFRLDDWGRLDDTGRPRPMHVEAGLAALDPASRPIPLEPRAMRSSVGRRHLLASCPFFILERIALAAGEQLTVSARGSAQTITCLRGAVEVCNEAGAAVVRAGETAILAANPALAQMCAIAPAVLLRTWVPAGFDDGEAGPGLINQSFG